MPINKVKGGYKIGNLPKIYPSKKEAVTKLRAIHATSNKSK